MREEMEQAVLGAVILDEELRAIAMAELHPEMFKKKAHRIIFNEIVSLMMKGQPVDFISVSDSLRGRGALDSVGGSEYLMQTVHLHSSKEKFKACMSVIKAPQAEGKAVETPTSSINNLDEMQLYEAYKAEGRAEAWEKAFKILAEAVTHANR